MGELLTQNFIIMEHTEKYLQAKWVTENPDGYDVQDVVDAKRYCNAYLDGYNQALRIHSVVVHLYKFIFALITFVYTYPSMPSPIITNISNSTFLAFRTFTCK